jgi:hypothetical protein
MARSPNVGGGPMTGSQDRVAEQGQDPYPVRPRESDPVKAELQERMERLPPGHPSSPYNDDGSRKPAPPDLSEYELPIPGDPDYRPEPTRSFEADGPKTAQTWERVTPGTSPDEGPERTAARRELREVPPDVEPLTDAEYTGHPQEARGRPDQVWAWGVAPNEQAAPDVPGAASQEEREASHDAPTDGFDERTAREFSFPDDPDYQPDLPRAFEADDIGKASAEDIDPHNSYAADRGPDRESPPDDQEGLGNLDSQEREERHLSEIIDQAVEKCREAEGRDADGSYGEQGLTPAMRRIEAQAEHGKLVPETEKYALKGHDRFKAKLEEMVDSEPDKPPEELAREIHDGIRYTFLVELEDYVVGVRGLTRNLEEGNYEFGVVKNMWDNDEYKGINTRWLDHESGVRFEVQFHTEESWTVKQRTHDAYKKIHNTDTPAEERERLRNYQREISTQVLQPPGWEEILDFRREGW